LSEPIDYRALIQDRKANHRRAIVREIFCLQPELYADLEEAQQDLAEQRLASRNEDPIGPTPDLRAGSLSPVGQLESAVAEIEKEIAAVSVVGVFKAPTSEAQAARHDALVKAQEDRPDDINQVVVESATSTILACFDHFEGPGRVRLDLNQTDLQDLMAEWSHGEKISLANRINRASTGANDAPKSVRSSLLTRSSDAT